MPVKNPLPNIDYHTSPLDESDVALVHLRGKNIGRVVTLDADDIELLISLGLSFSWQLLPTGHVQAPCSRSPRNWVLVARVLLDADSNTEVAYKDGNKSNLRRQNLLLLPSRRSQHRDRSYLRKAA